MRNTPVSGAADARVIAEPHADPYLSIAEIVICIYLNALASFAEGFSTMELLVLVLYMVAHTSHVVTGDEVLRDGAIRSHTYLLPL